MEAGRLTAKVLAKLSRVADEAEADEAVADVEADGAVAPDEVDADVKRCS